MNYISYILGLSPINIFKIGLQSQKNNKLIVSNPMDSKPRRVETSVVSKVGIDLEYCELCELKLSPNPIQASAHYSSKGHLKVCSQTLLYTILASLCLGEY